MGVILTLVDARLPSGQQPTTAKVEAASPPDLGFRALRRVAESAR